MTSQLMTMSSERTEQTVFKYNYWNKEKLMAFIHRRAYYTYS